MRTELSTPRTILFPVDLSTHTAGAAPLVSLVAQRFGSRVIVLHALEPVHHPFELLAGGMLETRSRTEIAREKIADCLQSAFAGVQFEIRVEEGEPAPVIVRTAEDTEADLICMPTRGHGPFRKFLLGSTAGKVLNDVAVPVLTGVHMDRPATNLTLDFRHIVCAFSPDERGATALRAALRVRDMFGAELTIVHALEASSREDVEAAIAAVGEASAHVVIEHGAPAQVVSRAAESADLVVIGRTAPGPLGRLRAQSYAIVRESPCPVLSV